MFRKKPTFLQVVKCLGSKVQALSTGAWVGVKEGIELLLLSYRGLCKDYCYYRSHYLYLCKYHWYHC